MESEPSVQRQPFAISRWNKSFVWWNKTLMEYDPYHQLCDAFGLDSISWVPQQIGIVHSTESVTLFKMPLRLWSSLERMKWTFHSMDCFLVSYSKWWIQHSSRFRKHSRKTSLVCFNLWDFPMVWSGWCDLIRYRKTWHPPSRNLRYVEFIAKYSQLLHMIYK